MRQIFLLILFLLVLASVSYAGPVILIAHHDLEGERNDFPWINQGTIMSGSAYKGNSFSRTDSSHAYGIGWKGHFPSSLTGRNVQLSVSAYYRKFSEGRVSLVISILQKDSTVYWEGRPLNSKTSANQDWTFDEETISLPMNMTGEGYTLLVYLWNEDGKSVFDVDEFHMEFSEHDLPTFVIPPDTSQVTDSTGEYMMMYSGRYLKLDYEKYSGHFRIRSANGRVLLHSFSLYTEWKNGKKDRGELQSDIRSVFFLRDDSLTEEGKYFRLEVRNEIAETVIRLFFPESSPVLRVETKTIFKEKVLLERLALSASFDSELREVYKYNSSIDNGVFQDEYWLGNGGFSVFSDSAGFIFYHPQKISSVQLKPAASRFTLNLDWAFDHPLLHWPLLKESMNLKENKSASEYNKGDVLISSFDFQILNRPRRVPVLRPFMSGMDAAILWTEHADYSDIRLQRAVNFGSDSILNADDAMAGFVGNRIPVTKSVFYSNPDHVNNSEKFGPITTEIANIKGTSGFREFLLDLKNHGHEICLHTPDQFTTTHKILEEALKSTKEDFNSVTWIDHGYDNALRSNREDLVCDGLDKNSEYVSIELWQKYGLKYLWNCFYEDSSLYSSYAFNSYMSLPYAGWGDRFPTPVYWKHPTRSDDIIHWRTSGTMDPPDGSLWNYFFSQQRLEDLMQTHATSILHVYPARADSSNGFYVFDGDRIFINPEFESVLQRQAKLRDEGRLQLSTVGDYLRFRTALDSVEINFQTDGKVRVQNKSNFDLSGISFSCVQCTAGVRAKSIKSRKEGDEFIFWFDLKRGETVWVDLLNLK